MSKYVSNRDMQRFFDLGGYHQPADRFIVHWLFNNISGLQRVVARNANPVSPSTEISKDFNLQELIDKPWAVRSCTIPIRGFRKETSPDGVITKSFPVLDSAEPLELTVLFGNEWDNGLIHKFINWMNRKQLTEDGFHAIPEFEGDKVLGDIIVQVINLKGQANYHYTFENVYLLKATDITYDNTISELPISVTFGADMMYMYFYDNEQDDEAERSKTDQKHGEFRNNLENR